MQATFLAAWSNPGAFLVPVGRGAPIFASMTTDCLASELSSRSALALAPTRMWPTTPSAFVRDSARLSPLYRARNAVGSIASENQLDPLENEKVELGKLTWETW